MSNYQANSILGPKDLHTKRMVFNLHGIGTPHRDLETEEQEYWLETELFESILSLDLSQTLLTIDDGNESDYTETLPRLKASGIKAIFFIPCNIIDQPGYLSREAIRILHDSGMEIGSHGINHINWRRLDDAALQRELSGSRKILEDILGTPIHSISCPYGNYDRRVLQQVRQAGYTRIYTSDGGLADLNQWIVSRTALTISHTLEQIERLARCQIGTLKQLEKKIKKAIKRWR